MLFCITLSVISSCFLLVQKNKYYSFDENIEALASIESSTLRFECNPNSPIIYCEKMCVNCMRLWRTQGKSGQFIRSLDNCVCGSSIN